MYVLDNILYVKWKVSGGVTCQCQSMIVMKIIIIIIIIIITKKI